MERKNFPSAPTGEGNEVEIAALTPHWVPSHFPAKQITGFGISLVLTFMAFASVKYHWLSLSLVVVLVLVLAFAQAALQLGIFMHLREGRGTLWHLPLIGLALFVGLGIVGFSIWIMLFKSGVS